jgi:hypothetical protein
MPSHREEVARTSKPPSPAEFVAEFALAETEKIDPFAALAWMAASSSR